MYRGNELLVSKFSNALCGSRELVIFFEICRIRGVSIISIHDRIVSRNIIFPETRLSDILNMLGALSAEVATVRRSSSHLNKLKRIQLVKSEKGRSYLERKKTSSICIRVVVPCTRLSPRADSAVRPPS